MIQLKRMDYILVAAPLIAAVIIYGFQGFPGLRPVNTALQAEVYINGELIHVIPLSEQTQRKDYRLETAYGYNVLTLENGQAKITEADCASQDCVRAHALKSPGEMTACLPHHLLIRLTGGSGGEVDAVAG